MNVNQTVVVHFVGLVLWTSAVTNDPGLHAILPRVHPVVSEPHSDTPSHQRIAAFDTIERHEAVLIFPASAVHDDSQWPSLPVDIPQKAPVPVQQRLVGYRHIRLNGEHLTMIPGAPNDPAAIPPSMPRI